MDFCGLDRVFPSFNKNRRRPAPIFTPPRQSCTKYYHFRITRVILHKYDLSSHKSAATERVVNQKNIDRMS